MADIPDQLDGIINDLAGLEDGLELGGFVLVHEVLIQVKAGGGEQGTGIIMQIGGQPLPFFFLQFDGGIQEKTLLRFLHILYLLIKALDPFLVQDDEYDKAHRKHQHPQGAQ